MAVHKSWSKYAFAVILVFLACNFNHGHDSCEARRARGTFDTNDFFVFVAKFGFQKTSLWNQNVTLGYIFGNITTTYPGFNNGISITRNSIMKRSVPSNDPVLDQDNKNSSKNSTATFNDIWSTINKISPSPIPAPYPITPSPSPSPPVTPVSSSQSSISPSVAPSTTAKPKLTPSISSTASTSTRAPVISSNRPRLPTPSTTPASSRLKYFPATLVVIDRSYFVDFYRARLIEDKDVACAQMFRSISDSVYDAKCFPYHKETFLRRIPCNQNEYCIDEKNTTTIVQGNQFTYTVSVKNQPRFWYVSIVACYLDQTSCQWKHSANSNITIDYDIWLVNGDPKLKKENPLGYQFSFDKHDTAEIYLVFFICYLILFPLQVHAVLRQKHIVPRLFTASVTLELGAVLANVVHILTFATDGEGYPKLAVFGDILDILARAIFMLILLVLAKGWAVTRVELRSKPLIFSIWVAYSVIHILLYVWNQTEVDVIEDIEEYQTWPGWLILVLRTVIMMWFVYELKDTMDHEHQPHKLNFFLHFGAAALVWFIYLPIVALIALQVSPLWRSKLLLGITYSADCLAFATMTHLLWPTRSRQYFLLASNVDTTLHDELEEFNEAPHVAERYNPYSSRSTGRNLHYPAHDVSFSESVSFTNTKKSNNASIHNSRVNGNGSGINNENGALRNNNFSFNFSDDGHVEDKDTSMLIQT